jgi:acylphosphatase
MESLSQKRVSITVTGRVQGVGFRYSAKHKAVELGLAGFAQNLFDGSVSIEVEGMTESVDRFIEWCRLGPPRARIRSVDIESLPTAGFTNFIIR